MEHFARWVVKRRKLVLILAVLLLIPSVLGFLGTYVNYDILTYLPEDLESVIGEGYLEDDFHMASTSMITVENMATADTLPCPPPARTWRILSSSSKAAAHS